MIDTKTPGSETSHIKTEKSNETFPLPYLYYDTELMLFTGNKIPALKARATWNGSFQGCLVKDFLKGSDKGVVWTLCACSVILQWLPHEIWSKLTIKQCSIINSKLLIHNTYN